MSDPVNLSSTNEEMHAAAVARHMAQLKTLQEKYDKLESAYDKLGVEAEALDDSYTQLSSTPELEKQNQEKLGPMHKQLEQMFSKLDGMYEDLKTRDAEIQQTKKTLRELSLKPDDSFRLDSEKDLGIDFEALDETASKANRVLKDTTKKFKDQWDGWETPEQYFDAQVKGHQSILKDWKEGWAKSEKHENWLKDRRDQLGSNVFKKVWNWREISKIDRKLKDAPDWRSGFGGAMKNTEKDIAQAERARERFHKNVAQMKEQKAEESLAKAQKSEVALKGEEDIGIDFKALSQIGKESEGQLNQMKGENELNRLTGELERLKKGQGTMERAFNHTDETWENLKNQRKELSGDPISRFRNKDKIKEIDNELEVVVPQWYALQGGKVKYQEEIARTEQAIVVCEKQIELAKQTPELQQSQHTSVRQTTHIHEGQQGTSEKLHQGVSEKSAPKVGGNVGTSIHVNHNGHGDTSEGQGPKFAPTNPYAQHVNGPKH